MQRVVQRASFKGLHLQGGPQEGFYAYYYTCQKLMAGEVIGPKRVPAGAVKLAQ